MTEKSLPELLYLAQGERSLNGFAREAGVDPGNFSRILKGQIPTPQVLQKLAHHAKNGVRYEDLMQAAGYLPPLFRETHRSDMNCRLIPLLGMIRAGIPALAEENCEQEIEIPPGIQADFALRVKGDSMAWAGINDGDLALLRQENCASHGMIVAAGIKEMDWEATLKFFVVENGVPRLRAGNPRYQDIILTDRHRIIGRLVKVVKDPPALSAYKDLLTQNEMANQGWKEAIETAINLGFDGKTLKKAIEVLALVRKV